MPFLSQLMPTVAAEFEGVYDLPKHILANTADALQDEEARFFKPSTEGWGVSIR